MKFVATATNLRARLQKHRQRRRAKAKSPKPAPVSRKPTPKPSTPSDGKPGWNSHFMRPSSSHRKLPLDDDSSRPSSRSGLRSRDGGRCAQATHGHSPPRVGIGQHTARRNRRGIRVAIHSESATLTRLFVVFFSFFLFLCVWAGPSMKVFQFAPWYFLFSAWYWAVTQSTPVSWWWWWWRRNIKGRFTR